MSNAVYVVFEMNSRGRQLPKRVEAGQFYFFKYFGKKNFVDNISSNPFFKNDETKEVKNNLFERISVIKYENKCVEHPYLG